MTHQTNIFDIFLSTVPGLESVLHHEVAHKGFKQAQAIDGGVIIKGGWPEVWRANLWIRGATSVLARLCTYRAIHFSEFENQARRFPWQTLLRKDRSFSIAASCSKSKIYHTGAVIERLSTIIMEASGAPYKENGDVLIKVRLDHDVCTLSVDTSGEPLYKRGYKEAVSKAPIRETLASLFLSQCGYIGTEAVFDPMCGSGTFVIEAAEIAARLNPGRLRHFSFENLKSFDENVWLKMKGVKRPQTNQPQSFGSDRDATSIAHCNENALRSEVSHLVRFSVASVNEVNPPTQEPGLVMVNPPYGLRLGGRQELLSLYATFGETMRERFQGWRVGLITSEPQLARATKLPFLPTEAPVPHGGIRIKLYRTRPLN